LEEILSRRNETRINQEVSVRLWGIDGDGKPFNEELRTTDISLTGAKLAGVKAKLRHGDIVGMQSDTGKARFRVTWAGKPESPLQGEISLCCVEPGKCIWDPKLLRPGDAPPLLEPLGSRRKSVRYVCPGAAEITPTRGGLPLWCKLADISYTGCYLESHAPLPAATEVLLKLTVDGVTIETPGQIRTSHTTVGMGVAFGDMGDEDAQKLGQLISRLSGTDDERLTASLEKYSAWLEGVQTSHDALESLRTMIESGEVEPEPMMSGDIERLLRAMMNLRECVLSRVTNYGNSRTAD
jgi:hypothetical protein